MTTARERAWEAATTAVKDHPTWVAKTDLAANAASDVWESLLQQIHTLANVSINASHHDLLVALTLIEEIAAEALSGE